MRHSIPREQESVGQRDGELAELAVSRRSVLPARRPLPPSPELTDKTGEERREESESEYWDRALSGT